MVAALDSMRQLNTRPRDTPRLTANETMSSEMNDHHPKLIRCGGQSYLFDMYSPDNDRIISRRRIEATALGPAEPIYRATLEHDGPAPTRRADEGHNYWVQARSGAYLLTELACDGPAVAVALDVATQPTNSDRGLVYLSLPVVNP